MNVHFWIDFQGLPIAALSILLVLIYKSFESDIMSGQRTHKICQSQKTWLKLWSVVQLQMFLSSDSGLIFVRVLLKMIHFDLFSFCMIQFAISYFNYEWMTRNSAFSLYSDPVANSHQILPIIIWNSNEAFNNLVHKAHIGERNSRQTFTIWT